MYIDNHQKEVSYAYSEQRHKNIQLQINMLLHSTIMLSDKKIAKITTTKIYFNTLSPNFIFPPKITKPCAVDSWVQVGK